MIKHIVMWTFKEQALGMDRAGLKLEARRRLEALPPLIPEIRFFQVGDNLSGRPVAMDLALVSDFETMEALAAYAGHPDHVKVAEFFRDAAAETRVVDYEF